MSRRIREFGKRYGRVVVVRELRGTFGHTRRVQVRCDCGIRKVVSLANLTNRHITSCGCRRKEVMAAKVRRHGLSNTPTYNSYRSMVKRVLNPHDPSYSSYRHVRITPRWLGPNGFLHFVQDLGIRPAGTTLGRIDDGNRYDKRHSQWQTLQEQTATRRKSRKIHSGK